MTKEKYSPPGRLITVERLYILMGLFFLNDQCKVYFRSLEKSNCAMTLKFYEKVNDSNYSSKMLLRTEVSLRN